MADLKKYKVFKNENFQVLTDTGFQDFEGIIVGENPDKIRLEFDDGGVLICTPKHKLIINDNDEWKYAKDLSINDSIYDNLKITSKTCYENYDKVYELLHVHNGHKYLINKKILQKNCLIIDEAAYIQPHIMDEFWNSVIPIISSSSNTKIFLISTANGTSNKFYDIYASAERGEAKEWHAEKMEWHELPGRGKKWKADMIESLGSQEAFDQEFGCMFIETGESAIAGSILDRWRKIRRPPIASLDGGHYLIWEPPKPDHIYSIGVDVAEGVGEAASCAQVIDITDLKNIRQVACYHDRLIDPHFFAEKLNKIANQWGRPYLAIERNNAGGQVIDGLFHTFGYNKFINVTTTGGNKDRFGVYSATSTKYKGVSNMRYWVNTLDVLDVNDIGLVQELETFIRRPNGVWKKKDGRNVYDDRVDAFFWALLCLETEVCQEYFDVVQYDERGKPSKIKNLFVEAPEYYKLDNNYQFNPGAPMPLLFGSEPDDPNNPNLNELIHGGWNFV